MCELPVSFLFKQRGGSALQVLRVGIPAPLLNSSKTFGSRLLRLYDGDGNSIDLIGLLWDLIFAGEVLKACTWEALGTWLLFS